MGEDREEGLSELMAIQRVTISATGAAGGAGTATATATSTRVVNGHIVAVYVEYLDTPPATTDVTIEEATAVPAVPILTISNAAANGWFYPRAAAVNTANSAITNSFALIGVSDYIKATIAQANNADGVNVTVVYDDGR